MTDVGHSLGPKLQRALQTWEQSLSHLYIILYLYLHPLIQYLPPAVTLIKCTKFYYCFRVLAAWARR